MKECKKIDDYQTTQYNNDLINENNLLRNEIAEIKERIKDAEQRLKDGERLRESLIRMTRERANKARHIERPKKNHGYIVQYIESNIVYCKGTAYSTWKVTLETPYPVAAGDSILNIVLRDLLDYQQIGDTKLPSLFELMNIKYDDKNTVKTIKDLTHRYKKIPDYDKYYNTTNYCYNITFRGNAKSYWQVILSCTKLPELDVFNVALEENKSIE